MPNTHNGLFPAEFIESDLSNMFHVNSLKIKTYPSSWRGAELRIDQNQILANASVTQFNPEAALNTEYNLTRTAGAIKNYIEQASEETRDGTKYYNFKFFINGYSFEIYDLDVSRYKAAGTLLSATDNIDGEVPLFTNDLYAYIRVGDMTVAENDLDFTRILMPFNWTAIDTPIPLDASLDVLYLIDQTDGTSLDVTKLPYGGLDWSAFSDDELKNNYVFTGLVLTDRPLGSINNDNTKSNYYGIQLIKNGQICRDSHWPAEVTAGDLPAGIATKIGIGLTADVEHMTAIGQYNTTTNEEDSFKTILAVGNGKEDYKQNAFEVSGYVSPNEVDEKGTPIFEQKIQAGPFEVNYNNELLNSEKNAEVKGIYTINDNIEIAKDGSHIIINKPFINEDNRQEIISNADIGVKAYGNVKLVGDGAAIHFVDWGEYNATTQEMLSDDTNRIVSTIQVVNVAGEASSVVTDAARGLQITNLQKVNQDALVFRPANSVSKSGKLKVINAEILVDNLANNAHSLEIGKQGQINTLALSGDQIKLVADSSAQNAEMLLNGALQIKASGENNFEIKLGTDDSAPKFYRNSTGAGITGLTKLNNISMENNQSIMTSISRLSFTNDAEIVSSQTGPLEISSSKGLKVAADTDSTFEGDVTFNGDIVMNNSDNSLMRSIISVIYPVGSIYMSMSEANPATLFPGTTWSRISEGRMLLGAGNGYTANSTGGHKDAIVIEHQHDINGHKHTVEVSKTEFTANDFSFISDHAKHTHTGTATASDDSNHKHNIPVSRTRSKTTSWHDNAGYTHPDNFGAYFPDGHHNAITDLRRNTDPWTWYVWSQRKSWPERTYLDDDKEDSTLTGASGTYGTGEICEGNTFRDKGRVMIPSVAMGSWFTPRRWTHDEPSMGNLKPSDATKAEENQEYKGVDIDLYWNKPGQVFTGYQVVKVPERWGIFFFDLDAKGNPKKTGTEDPANYYFIDDLGNFADKSYYKSRSRWGFHKDSRFTLDGGKTYYYRGQIKTKTVGTGKNAKTVVNSWIVCPTYKDWRDAFVTCWWSLRRFKYTGGAATDFLILNGNGEDPNGPGYNEAGQQYESTDWGNKHWNSDNLINDYCKLNGTFNTKAFVSDVYNTLDKIAGGHTAWQFWGSGASDLAAAGTPAKRLLALCNLKDAFTRDWFQRTARLATSNESKSGGNYTDFRFRVDDGKHTHTLSIAENDSVQRHDVIKDKFKTASAHKHELACSNTALTTASAGFDGTDANIPPYLVCYIWKRIS